MRKGKPLLLLLMIFGLLNGQGAVVAVAPDAELIVQGRIYSTTCTVQTPGDGTSIALEEVTTQALHDARSFPVSPKEFTINVSCSSPSNWHEVTGKFTTDGEIEGSNFSVHLKIRLPIRLAQNMSAYKLKIKLPILLLISVQRSSSR